MKILDRAAVILLNLCLLVVFIIAPALMTASDPGYYEDQFEKNGIYSHTDKDGNEKRTVIFYIGGNYQNYAEFDNGQLDALAKHIIDYLFGDKESFALTMDNIKLNGAVTDGVEIFGATAVSHMKDVKVLMHAALVAAVISAVLLVISLVYIVIRRKEAAPFLLKYTLIFYAAILLFIVIFVLITLFSEWELIRHEPEYFLDLLWRNVHHLLFPFQPEKFENSFFNDTLTQILTLELFLDALVIVFITLFSALAAWLTTAIVIKRLARKGSTT